MKTCICCTYLCSSFEQDWSELTPGMGVQVFCGYRDDGFIGFLMSHDDFNSEASLHDNLRRAETCPHFKRARHCKCKEE